MVKINYTCFARNCKLYWALLCVFAVLVINGFYFARLMDREGHWITGMSNQVVWGVPHVFAIFLIVTASGVLHIASLSSVFGKDEYKGWARLSGLLAVALLLGGLAVLVLDLGRPDRLIIALTHYNFKSVFAWNVFLYTGFILAVIFYLWMMFEPKMHRKIKFAGMLGFSWRLVLTAGTGSIFAVLIARDSYGSWIMVPLFIALSFSSGIAFFIIFASAIRQRPFLRDGILLGRLGKLLGIFIGSALIIGILFHGAKLMDPAFYPYEKFILLEGGIYTVLLHGGYLSAGTLIPLILLFVSDGISHRRLIWAGFLHVVGVLAFLYVIVIGGQAYPLSLFPGMDVSSSFFDGSVARYCPSAAEFALGVSGLSLAILFTLLSLRILPFLPEPAAETGN